jgi:ELWxxDGT repeat protein
VVADISGGPASSTPQRLTNVNGTLFFTATEPVVGRELWKSDGTLAGTTLVKDVGPGNAISYGYLTNVAGTLFFTARTAAGEELWKSDGTVAGTTLVRHIFWGEQLVAEDAGNAGNLFFSRMSTAGWRLWKSDGTEPGTDTWRSSYPRLTPVGNLVFFGRSAFTPAQRRTIAERTCQRQRPPHRAQPTSLTNVNGTLFCCERQRTAPNYGKATASKRNAL